VNRKYPIRIEIPIKINPAMPFTASLLMDLSLFGF